MPELQLDRAFVPGERLRFAILGSGRGSNAAVLMSAFQSSYLATDAELAVVVSNVKDAGILQHARAHSYASLLIESRGITRSEHEQRLLHSLQHHAVQHLLLAGYQRILSPDFIRRFGGIILNIHPSLLPDFPGLSAVAAQWRARVRVAGATVHVVDEGVDTGPVLLSGAINVRGDEGEEGLAARILTEVEHVIYPQAVRLLLDRLRRGAHVHALPAASDASSAPTTSAQGALCMNAERSSLRRALLSVFDKRGVVELGQGLVAHGVELLASGGTATMLRKAGLPVIAVEDYTAAPEVLDGRVKTLHPKIAAGILADRRQDRHLAQLHEQGYPPIDLVVCNLYPFAQAVQAGRPRDEVIEMIDIGGPSLIRAAAKNHDGGVAVLVDSTDYASLLAELAEGGIRTSTRRRLAARALALTAAYDTQISAWFAGQQGLASNETEAGVGPVAASPLSVFVAPKALRYGENPHQTAQLYYESGCTSGVAYATQLAGKELSYNNYLDLDAAHRAVAELAQPACAIVKHNNPCGLAQSQTLPEAFAHALAADPVSAFGSVIGLNRPLCAATVELLLQAKLFVECIIAPAFSNDALERLRDKPSLRLLRAPPGSALPSWQLHRIGGGLLWQKTDPGIASESDWRWVTQRTADVGFVEELRFAMHAVTLLRSNAIAITRNQCLVGAGAGQTSRIDAAMIAISKAGERSKGAFLASDAFFPFPDCVEAAAAAGIVAIAQPGGSVRDTDSIAACDHHGIAMVFTGRRHFRH